MSKQKKSRYKIIIWIAVIIIAILVAVVVFEKKNTTTYKEVLPTTGNITTYYSFTGSVDAKNRKTVYADKAMQISDIFIKEGDKVNKDDVLFKTTTGEEILAPIDGEIAKLKVEVNAQLLPGSTLTDVVDYSVLQLKVQVDEYDLSAISVGKQAVIRMNALDKEFNGTIDGVSKEGIYANGVTYFNATFLLVNDGSINVGMSAEAKVLKDDVKDTMLLPMSVINFDNKNAPYVYVKDDKGNPVRRDIKVGVNDGTNVQILDGIKAEDIILLVSTDNSGNFGFGN